MVGKLSNTNCEPCEFTASNLQSRQRIIKAGESGPNNYGDIYGEII